MLRVFFIFFMVFSLIGICNAQDLNEVKFKKIIFGCRTTDIRDFEKFVIRAKNSGATHINLTNEDIPLARWQYSDESDPYPAWVITNIGLLKVATPKALQSYLPRAYAEEVFSILESRCKILRKYGLKASLTTFEPQMLPEKVFEDHPQWRGPRVDHPARSRTARWAPDIDNMEVLQLYKEAIDILLKRCPEIDIIQFNTNDSGTGLSWSAGLYSGGTGNTFNKERTTNERIFSFFHVLQTSAQQRGNDLDIHIRWTREKFPESIAKGLTKGMAVENLEGPDAKPFATEVGSVLDYYNFFYPVIGIPTPVKFVKGLEKGYSSTASRIFIFIGDFENRDLYFDLYDAFKANPSNDILSRLTLLKNFATQTAGESGSRYLFDLWNVVGEAEALSDLLQAGGFIYYLGCVQQRWLTRPFVPFPSELKWEEKAYYRKFQFQARSEAEADDLSNMQATSYYKGWSGMYHVTNIMNKIKANITTARTGLKNIVPLSNDSVQIKYFKLLDAKLQAVTILSNNAENAITYQAQIDRINLLNIKPEVTPEHGAGSTWDRNFLLETARKEIDNTVLLINLLEQTSERVLDLAPKPEMEDIRMLSPELKMQLKLKLKIMNAHWLDYDRIFTTPNL